MTNDETGQIEAVSRGIQEDYDNYLQWRQETSFLGPMFEVFTKTVWRFLPVFMKFDNLSY